MIKLQTYRQQIYNKYISQLQSPNYYRINFKTLERKIICYNHQKKEEKSMHSASPFHFLIITPFLCIFTTGLYTSPSQNLNYTLGTNLIVNYDISVPNISDYLYVQYPGTMNGWSTKILYVQYICIHTGYAYAGDICLVFKGASDKQQFIDTDSDNSNEQYYQRFNLTADRQFQLKFDWISSSFRDVASMGFTVLWNGVTLYTIYDVSCILKTQIFYVISINGINQVVFQGLGKQDSLGIFITNVFLQEIFYNKSANTQNFIDFWQLNNSQVDSQSQGVYNLLSILNSQKLISYATIFSPLKQNAKFIFGYFLEFNHLLLYNYHLLNYTSISRVILAGIQGLEDQKSYILDNYLFPLLGTSTEAIVANYQQKYSLPKMNQAISVYSQGPNSILIQFINTFTLDLPITFIFFFFGGIALRIFFKCKISVLFRQYSLYGVFLYILLDGRIQILTFHFISKLLMLVSINFKQKIATTLIIVLYFFVFFFAAALIILLKSSNKKIINQISQNFKKIPARIQYITVHFGLFNILLGFSHRLLLFAPLNQLYTLLAIELLYLTYLFKSLFTCCFVNKVLGMIFCCMNLSRFVFIFSLLAYQLFPSMEVLLIVVQQYIFYSLIALWGLSALASFVEKIILVWRAIKRPSIISPLQAGNHNQGVILMQKKKMKNNDLKIVNYDLMKTKRIREYPIQSMKQLVESKRQSQRKYTKNIYSRQTRGQKIITKQKIKPKKI